MIRQGRKREVSPHGKPRVFVGLSGGVDSSVSAALLKKAGYDVTGVFIKVWQPDLYECTWREDRLDAMRVCAKLEIPFATLDLEKEYKKEVVDYMIREYKAGRTPNPDVMCNRYIKFGAFFKWAIGEGADYVATGHYVRAKQTTHRVERTTEYRLFAGKDKSKDQSYFLWTLTQKELAQALFPVGHLKKLEVRKIAKKLGLPTADKKDSQGLCFVGKIDMKEFLQRYVSLKRGAVLDSSGAIIGDHPGALFFTIGERHGFTITKKTPRDTPLYVTAKNVKANAITVSARKIIDQKSSKNRVVLIEKVNWIRGNPPRKEKMYTARVCYRQPLEACRAQSVRKTSAEIVFTRPQRAIAPGQSLVLYDAGECLGGGVISR